MSYDDEPIVPCPYCGVPMPESVCERLRPTKPPAWVEPLASSWERRAREATSDTLSHFGADDAAAVCAARTGEHVARACAEELREHAKGGT